MKIIEAYGYNYLKQPPDNILFDSLYFLPELPDEVREVLTEIVIDIYKGRDKRYSNSLLMLVYHTYKKLS